ncbi:MAG: hypothetical protein JXR60_06055 [Bacteroidales bacterium]|nr:hypothetical protein [Bacteroidales bacterium]
MNKNALLKACRVQEIDMFFTDRGFSRTFIHKKILQPNFFISKRTYYRFLGVNAKRILKERFELDWKVELAKQEPFDYIGIMKNLKDAFDKNESRTSKSEYDDMVKEGSIH